jgi:aminomethyltransferase
MQQAEIKTTPLHDWHTAHGANMADFGGYDMPLWYSSAKNEHLSVLTGTGLFDTSHMAVLLVAGAGARELLQLCFTNDLEACVGGAKKPLCPGRCVYGAYLNDDGCVLDDTIIYMLQDNHYMAVVNAGMGGEVARHLESRKEQRDVSITDLTDKLGKIDVQGPLAGRIMARVLADPQAAFEKLFYFSFKGFFDPDSDLSSAVRLTDGTPVMLSRTGYTGEFGFELYMQADRTVGVWEMIRAAAGDALALTPCGLAARDSLRGGAVLPLSHQDIGPWPFINHPWEFALPFNDDRSGFTKAFIGAKALLNVESPEYTYPFVGNDLRKVSTGDPAVVLDADGNQIGQVLTCVTDMGIGRHEGRIYSIASPGKPGGFKPRGLSCGFIKVSTPLSFGQVVELRDNRRKLKVTLVEDVRPDRTARRPISEMT